MSSDFNTDYKMKYLYGYGIDFIENNNSHQVSQSPLVQPKEQATSAVNYTVNDVKKDDLSEIDKLYKKLSDTFMEWGISVEQAKSNGIIGQIAGKNENELTVDDSKRVEACITRAKRFVKAQHFELNLENLINAANKMNVATIGSQYSFETVDAEIAKMENGKRSSLFQHQDLNDFMERYYGVDFDNMTFEQIQAKAKKLGIQLSDYTNLKTDEEKLNAAKKELKAGMLNKYFSQHEFNSPAQQLDDFTKMLINTKNPEERKMFVEGVKTLYAENKEPAIQKLLASFTEIADRMDAADKLGQNIEEITTDTTNEQTENIARIITAEQSETGATETAENLNKTLEQIAEIIHKQRNGVELTDEEKALLDKFEQYMALNKGKDQGFLTSNNIPDILKEELLYNSYSAYSKVDKEADLNVSDVMKDAICKYMETHPKTGITKEKLIEIIETSGCYVEKNAPVSNTSNKSANPTNSANSTNDYALTLDNTLGYQITKSKEEANQSLDRVTQITSEVTPETPQVVVTSKSTAQQVYRQYGSRGIEIYCKNRTGKEICKEAFQKGANKITSFVNKAVEWISRQTDKEQANQLLSFGADLDLIKECVSTDALVKASQSGHAPSTTAKQQLKMYAEKVDKTATTV